MDIDLAHPLPRMRPGASLRPLRPGWQTVAWLLLLAVSALSLAAGDLWREQARDTMAASFRDQAVGVGATVSTALRRMDDLTVAARAKIASDPELSNSEFSVWYRSMGARNRYPGAVGFGYIQLVQHAGLDAHFAAIQRDPVPGFGALGTRLRITPAGRRDEYCLVRLGVAGPLNQLTPGGYGLDVCGLPGAGAPLLASRDSGLFTTFGAQLASGEPIVMVLAPVYNGGGVPPSIPERRGRMQGWVTGIFDVGSVLGDAVAGDSSLTVTVQRDAGAANLTSAAAGGTGGRSLIAKVGALKGGGALVHRVVVHADGKWIVTIQKSPHSGTLSPTAQGFVVASAGLLVALLLFTLVQVLSRGRARALRMVAEKTDQLRHQALHDTLTDLPNRALIVDRAQQALVRGRREHCAPAAMFIDLDNFKGVNDMFGHAVGDALLRAVAARVSAVLREGDTVGRIGGDEFVVLVEGGPAKADPELVAERLLQVLREPYELPGTDGPIVATASIGLAIGDRVSADALLRDADIALYEAKAAGRNTAVVFRQEMQAAVHDRLALETDLRHAVENDELRLDYQPVFDLEQNRITGVEALLRWDHPARGAVMPCEFIPLAEETGLILELGAWALETACRQGAAWHASGYRVRMAVNVSARQLAEPGFPAAVQAALEATGFDPHWLVLEVTETMLMQNTERTAARLAALKAVGVRIAIDDFGTGYSSLAYLQQFPVDALKIDRAFIAGIARSPESKALIHTLVELGKSLGLETVAEGIEQTVQLSHLRREECASGQGFLLARPLAPGQVERLLEREAA